MHANNAQIVAATVIEQRTTRRQFAGGVAALALGGWLSAGWREVAAKDATPGAEAEGASLPELKIRSTGSAIEMLGSVPSGRYLVTLENVGTEGVDAFLMRLPEGVTMEEVDALVAAPTGLPDWRLSAIFADGPTVLAGRMGMIQVFTVAERLVSWFGLRATVTRGDERAARQRAASVLAGAAPRLAGFCRVG